MTSLRQSAVLAGILLAAACQRDSLTDPSGASSFETATAGITASAASGGVRVRCETGRNRSTISIDGRNLRPATGTFSAKATSGANIAAAPAQRAVAGEAEFDFDSDRGDIAAGAVAIAAGFISGPVTGQILDATGTVIASSTVTCTSR